MNRRTIFLLTAGSLWLSGCMSSITEEQAGPMPSMDQAEYGVRQYVQNCNLLDPDSALVRNIQIGKPVSFSNINGTIEGWKVTFELNAKNAYGGYTGYRQRWILVKADGQWRALMNQYP